MAEVERISPRVPVSVPSDDGEEDPQKHEAQGNAIGSPETFAIVNKHQLRSSACFGDISNDSLA